MDDAKCCSGAGINKKRVIFGGLLAGLVISVGEFGLNFVLLGKEWAVVMASLNRPPVGGKAVLLLNLMCFAFGTALVGMYTAIRPRFGAGPQTAIKVGVVAWFFAYVLAFGWSYVMSVYPAKVYFLTIAWSFLEINLAALVGGWAYKE